MKLVDILKEVINASDAYSTVGSIQTVIDGKRDVAVLEFFPPQAKQLDQMVKDGGLKKVKLSKNPYPVYIVFRPGAEDAAMELDKIASRYGGFLGSVASEKDSRRIGELLGYKQSDIEDYIRHNKKIKSTK
jgi:hypothetical protein